MIPVEEDTLPTTGLIDAKRITAYLGISRSMWCKLQTTKVIKPPIKIGRAARWNVDYVRELASVGVSLSKKN